jgi:1A family penicillin-binding protein
MIKHFKKKTTKNIFLFILGFGLVFMGLILFWLSNLQLPDFKSFTDRKMQSSTKIYDRTGEILLYDIHKDIKRTVVPYEEMGTNILNATVAIEDSDFYQHNGIRIKAIIRAVWSNISGGKTQGGSTITQQLIKNTLLTSKVTISRKIKEWILAIKIEKVMSKEEILSLYLNEAPYGGNIYGIEEATKAFFGKRPKELTIAEAAYLAAIPNGPTYYSPYRKNKDKLDERKNLVLRRMIDLNFINQEEYNQSLSENVVFLPEQLSSISAPHFVFFIKDYLEKRYGVNSLEGGGFKVITTLDYELQKKAEEIAKTKALENEVNWNGKNAAIVVLDPKTGQILSMVGSRDYFDKEIDGNFNVTTASRQPGSSFKPIVYALAFEKGYTEETTFFDVKTEFNASCNPNATDPSTRCYNPSNHDGGFRGPMNLRNALAQSINVMAVKLLYLVGVSDSIKMARNLGITTLLNDPNRYGLSLVIGGGETTLLDMTSAYGVFANNGIKNPPTGILEVLDNDGNILEKYENKSGQVLQKTTTDLLSSILSDNTARIPTFGANSVLRIPGRDVAAKTGTTNDNKDAWTIGYTPSIAVGVWVGNNDNIPMKKGGVSLAGPIWNQVMNEAIKNLPNEKFAEPPPTNPSLPVFHRGFWQGGELFTIDSISGGLATEYTPDEFKKDLIITDVHSILHWMDKENPLEYKKSDKKDSQYDNWEYGVRVWWENNKFKYPIITEAQKPDYYDNVHTLENKPIFEIIGVNENNYKETDPITVLINPTSFYQIKKIDLFINNKYITSLKNYPHTTTFFLKDFEDISPVNELKVIGFDVWGNMGENNISILADID